MKTSYSLESEAAERAVDQANAAVVPILRAAMMDLGHRMRAPDGSNPTVSSVACIMLRHIILLLSNMDAEATADLLRATADTMAPPFAHDESIHLRQINAQLRLASVEMADSVMGESRGTA